MLEWAIERFAPRIAISTAFQIDGAVLIHMAYEIDPAIRVFSVDTGRLPPRRSTSSSSSATAIPGCSSSCSCPTPRPSTR